MRRNVVRSLVACAVLGTASGAFAQGVSFNPASLDFGVLPPKTKKQLPVQVSAPAGVPCTLSKPPRFAVTPSTFTGAAAPVSVSVEFDNGTLIQQEQEVFGQGFIEVKCGTASGKLNVKGGLQAAPPRATVELTQKGQPDGEISFTVQGDPQHPDPKLFCGQAGGGGGAFGSTGSVSFSCGDRLHIGSVVKYEVLSSTRFLKFSGGTGSAAGCTGLTSKVCTFTVGPSGGRVVAEYKPPDPKFRIRLRREGEGAGTVEALTSPANKKVVTLSANDNNQLGILDVAPNLRLRVKATAAAGSAFLGFSVKKPAGVTCPRKSDECTFDLNPATLDYEIDATFRKGVSATGSKN